MNTIAINMAIDIPEQALKDVFVTALEQGAFWAEPTSAWNESVWDDESGSFVFVIRDGYTEDENERDDMTVTLETMRLGLERILSGQVKYGRPDQMLETLFECPGGWDSIEADCILQAGLFNDIIYG
jgi:hypothetical protein